MSDEKASGVEYAFFFAGVAVGVAVMLGLGFTVLPKGVILFGIYGVIGAIGGGMLGQLAYKKFNGKK